jgi:uncharacterized protein YbjQ (UPF0145 family)
MNAGEPPFDLEEQADEQTSQAGERRMSDDEQAESLRRVEAGGIPLAAERRLREIGEQDGAFTSDLSVADFALCHRLGLKPVAQVMGSSIYQVGFQSTPWPSGMGGEFMFEMEALSDAWNEVRGLALNRLAQEAEHVGADAVIGVDLRTDAHDWAENALEYMVIGTAVRHTQDARAREDAKTQGKAHRGEPSQRSGGPRHSAPVLTELSVADYTKLLSAGIEPLGIVAWSSVFFVASSYATQRLNSLTFTQNQELTEFTQGVYSAREIVVERMTEQAAKLGASGVIGVRIAHNIGRMSVGSGTYSRGGLMVTFHAIGNAIRDSGSADPQAPEPIIDLTT